MFIFVSIPGGGGVHVAGPNAYAEKNIPILSLACDPGSHTVVAGTELEASYQASVALWLVVTSCYSDVLRGIVLIPHSGTSEPQELYVSNMLKVITMT